MKGVKTTGVNRNRNLLILIIVLLAIVFLGYTGIYYHADPDALAALESDGDISVTRTEEGWFFDGPSDKEAIIFYPGAKVDETAYAPLLHRLAREGIDVFLVKMPFRLAFLGMNEADGIISQYEYDKWYIGGHSLGGAMAAVYAAEHGDRLKGVILLAAYPTKMLDDGLMLISIYGSEDHVLNRTKVEQGVQYVPGQYVEHVIEGGNHAEFGNYGQQRGDGTAEISAREQQAEAVRVIVGTTGEE